MVVCKKNFLGSGAMGGDRQSNVGEKRREVGLEFLGPRVNGAEELMDCWVQSCDGDAGAGEG